MSVLEKYKVKTHQITTKVRLTVMIHKHACWGDLLVSHELSTWEPTLIDFIDKQNGLLYSAAPHALVIRIAGKTRRNGLERKMKVCKLGR